MPFLTIALQIKQVTIAINKTHSEGVTGYTKLGQPETTERLSISTGKNGYYDYSTISTDGGRYKTIADIPFFQEMPIKANPQIKKKLLLLYFRQEYFSYHGCHHALFRNCFFYWINNCNVLWPKNRLTSTR